MENQYSEGWTNTADGLGKIRTEVFGRSGDRGDVTNVLITVTDGIPTRNEANTAPNANALKNDRVKMYSVGITQFIDEDTLKLLSTGNQRLGVDYFISPDFSSLSGILDTVLSSTCQVTTPAPTRKYSHILLLPLPLLLLLLLLLLLHHVYLYTIACQNMLLLPLLPLLLLLLHHVYLYTIACQNMASVIIGRVC